MKYNQLYINGEWVNPISNQFLDIENPANRKIIEKVPRGNEEDVNVAVEAAKNAFVSWKNLGPGKRQEYVQGMIDHLVSRFEEMAPVLASELGSTEKFALKGHLEGYEESMYAFLEHHKSISYVEDRGNYRLYRRPQGIVACITPWNYPFGQIAKKVIPALLAGNTVILKPSKSTPLTAYFWAEAAESVNLPKGVFNLVTGKGGEVGNVLADHPDVNAITFTGSTNGGKEIASHGISHSVKRVTLELGGKSAAIFLKGADYSDALKGVLDSVYLNVGQTCSAKTRLLIPREERETIEKLLIEKTKEYPFGNPLLDEKAKVGVLNSEDQWNKVKKYVELGLKEGAKILYGEVPEEIGTGYEIQPVIFTDVLPDMKIAQEEIFGPVLSVLFYDTIEEAIEIANNSIYGLSGIVYGPDKEEALLVASEIRTGQVQVNGAAISQDSPFGGFKESGMGREGALEGLEEFYEYQTIFI
ncbi:aldehyde dehydrogenase family protein [Peptoniphilus sp. KCTC 25270]|uniref:aldehyde dehydrogenase family protein n=1 Tax=Peptoniphilus sp. KCTC 25270 TaxID=2897414 RepID=UPI001E4E8C98|nr:aldehyde dehydrogenase family protein [Peptoniphilus sp. KCTC 25270]MCD1147816.1 aldehyde dehydrogenase family protein [Peptoniphilus sp. KCTC 25270]